MSRRVAIGPAPAPATAGGPIWLVRHAPTTWTGVRWCGRSDPELTSAGRAAALRVARDVAADIRGATASDRRADAVVLASPLRRSLDTAVAIATALGTRLWIDPDLAEIDFGVVDGLTWDEVLASQPTLAATILAGRDPDWPGGETRAAVDARAARTAGRIRALSRAAPVVVVSHGGFLAAIAGHLGGESIDREVRSTLLRLEPAAMIRLDVADPAAATTSSPRA